MINWQSVIFNSFWILGLSVLLAAISFQHWTASQNERSLRQQLGEPGFLRFFWLAVLLFAIGLAGTSQELYERILWICLAVAALLYFLRLSRPTKG